MVADERGTDSVKTIPPELCPICKTKLFKPENEVAFYCINNECPAQMKGKNCSFCSQRSNGYSRAWRSAC